MSGAGNKMSAQEDLNVYEDVGAGTAEPIFQNEKGRVGGENVWMSDSERQKGASERDCKSVWLGINGRQPARLGHHIGSQYQW